MKLDEALKTLKKAGFIIEGSMSLEDKIANAKDFNKGIDEMKKDAVRIFKQAFYEDEVIDNGDGTYTVTPMEEYDIRATYTWDDNDTLTIEFNFPSNKLTFKHLSQHLSYVPRDDSWEGGRWEGDAELERFISAVGDEFQNVMSY